MPVGVCALRAVILTAGMLVVGDARGADVPTAPAIAVVVGEKSTVEGVSLDQLRALYLRRQRRWPGGEAATPVNLPADHPLRERFSRIVLGRSPTELVSYWDARYFDGTTPPAVLPSPAAIRAYLAEEPGAIGYLPADESHEGCRVLLLLTER